jgi:hypothetical protein
MATKRKAKPGPSVNGDSNDKWMPSAVTEESRQNLRNMGVEERFIVDRTTHPSFHATSWSMWGNGHRLLGDKLAHRLPHMAHQSILITVMSNMWSEGAWHRFQDMVKYTEEQGYDVSYQEVDNYAFISPRDAIGTMRASSAMLALDAGVEWCFMIDTDVLLEKDTLVRLMGWDMPIVYPYLVDLEQKYAGATLMRPVRAQGTGLQPVVWAAMSAMLFYTKVFNGLPPHAWYGHDFHFAQYLNHVGHRIYVDTDTPLNVAKGPARHGAQSWDQIQDGIKKTFHNMRNEDRDRRPPPGYDPVFGEGDVTPDGAYWRDEPPWRKREAMGQNDFEQNGEVRTRGGVL